MLDDKKFTTDSKKEKSQKLLAFIDETLKTEGKNIQDVTEVNLNTGPGSFTGLRVGAAVANTICWDLDIPLNGQDISKKPIKLKY